MLEFAVVVEVSELIVSLNMLLFDCDVTVIRLTIPVYGKPV